MSIFLLIYLFGSINPFIFAPNNKKGRSNEHDDYIIGHVGYSTAFCSGKCGLCVVVVCKIYKAFPTSR